MNILNHVLAVALGVQLMDLKGLSVFYAFLFGVGPDLDHIFKLPGYMKRHGFSIVRYYPWRSLLQEPISLLWVAPLSVCLDTRVPVIFFASHIVLDYLMCYSKKPFQPICNMEVGNLVSAISDKRKQLIFFTLFLFLNIVALMI